MRCAGAMLLFVLIASAAAADDGTDLVRVEDRGQASLWVAKREGDPLQVKMSQTLTIVMRVDGMAPLEVQFSEKVRSTEGWHLEATGKPKTTALDGSKRVRWEQTFKATPLQPGPQPLPLPALQFTENDEAPRDVAWTPLALTITTRFAKADISEARDLAPIEELPPAEARARPWWPWLCAGVPFVAIAGWWLLRRRARPLEEPTARATALRQLAALTEWPTATPADIERLHTEMSDVLRRYLERRFDLPATRRTTPEFLSALTSAGPLAVEHQTMLRTLLERCDLAKFAAVAPDPEECQRALTLARAFVEQADTGRKAVSPAGTPAA